MRGKLPLCGIRMDVFVSLGMAMAREDKGSRHHANCKTGILGAGVSGEWW